MANAARTRASAIDDYNPAEDFYQLLDVEPDATPDQIRKAHRKRMQAAHPDRGGSTRQAAILNHARDTLLDAELRQRYDQQRAAFQQAFQWTRDLFAQRFAPATWPATEALDADEPSTPSTPPLRLFSLLADEDVARALLAGKWSTALGLALLGRFSDWLFDAGTAGDSVRAAMLRELAAQVRAAHLRQLAALGRDMLLHLVSPQSPRSAKEVIDVEALAASLNEVLRGEALTPRSYSKRATPTAPNPAGPRSRRAASPSITKRTKARSARSVRS